MEFCPLNQPQCKRSIMTSKEPFAKRECPISKGWKCPFTPSVCPMIYQNKEECYLPKIQDLVNQGGCNSRNVPVPCIAQMGKNKNEVSGNDKLPAKTIHPPGDCAELPPCPRCPLGRQPKNARGSNDSKNKMNSKKAVGDWTLSKNEDIKVAASPGRPHLGDRKTPKGRKKSRKAMERPQAGMTKTDDIKVANSGRMPESLRAESRVTSPGMREKIFKEAIADKVAKLTKNRESLLVPQCSLASRRPLPCAGCLIDFLSTPPSANQQKTNYVYRSEEDERCRLKRMASCPALRVPSMCPSECFCPDVALLDEEEEDSQMCPFAKAGTSVQPVVQSIRCPLSRLPKNPLILDPSKLSDRGAPPDPCKCPLIPNNCCYTIPACPVHSMRAL